MTSVSGAPDTPAQRLGTLARGAARRRRRARRLGARSSRRPPKTNSYHLTATAKAGGGTFDRWDVTAADGDKPHILSNTGGEVAKLVLYGDGWVYYWKQTDAARDAWGNRASFRVVDRVPATRRALDDARAVGRYDPYTDTLYLKDTLLDEGCCNKPDGTRNEGIDCFGETIWHESTHRMELTAWWGPEMARYPKRCSEAPSIVPLLPLPLAPPVVVVCPEDLDMDWVPDDIDCGGLHADPACKALPACNSVKVGHIEMHAYEVGRSWRTGSLKSKDWAYPGSQWPAGK